VKRCLHAIRLLNEAQIKELLDLTLSIKENHLAGRPVVPPSPSQTVGLLFFENSTRTRVAFSQAASLLGHSTVQFGSSGSSISKGETLKDTLLTLGFAQLDAMVIRHSASGATQMASKHFGGPIVNAGDGQHEHPTQALGDAVTILQHKGRLDGLKVAIVGDVLHSRVARSNAWFLSRMGAEVRFVGPRTLIPSATGSLPVQVFYDLRTGISGCDVVMTLRLQRERMQDGLLPSGGDFAKQYQINRQTIRSAAPEAIIMHPGPLNRGMEIDDWAADGPQSVILDQVGNGIYAKTAALAWALGADAPKVGGVA
jgi:aspartate carbamoyltransferase catalytic subunit